MKYKCTFCKYETNNKSQIHFHHIIPKELNGNNKKHNIIAVCGICHSKIFIRNSKYGIHSIKNNNSIEIVTKRNNGLILEYIENNNTKFISI